MRTCLRQFVGDLVAIQACGTLEFVHFVQFVVVVLLDSIGSFGDIDSQLPEQSVIETATNLRNQSKAIMDLHKSVKKAPLKSKKQALRNDLEAAQVLKRESVKSFISAVESYFQSDRFTVETEAEDDVEA